MLSLSARDIENFLHNQQDSGDYVLPRKSRVHPVMMQISNVISLKDDCYVTSVLKMAVRNES